MRRALLILAGAVIAAGLAAAFLWPRAAILPPSTATPGPRLLWTFEAPQPGFVVAAPVVTDRAVYLAAGHARGFQRWGAVYALDSITGKPKWVYDRDGEMLPTASTPLVASDRLFVGEGLHNHFSCRLHCLDTTTGKSDWSFPTEDHIEGGPALADGLVIFSAGNDGLYALDAKTGKRRWNFAADLHIDSTPCLANGRVFAGSGPSRRFDASQVVCLDVRTGIPAWRTPVPLPAWGSPVVAKGRVFVGLGNGRLTTPAAPPETPAGGLACLDAATGAELWTVLVGDAVFGRLAVVGDRVVFGSRDENLYGRTFDGRDAFRLPMGGPVMAGPVADANLVYAVSVAGRVVCANPADGREQWRYELSQRGARPQAYAALGIAGQRLYVAAEMTTGPVGIVCLHCFELPTDTPGNAGP